MNANEADTVMNIMPIMDNNAFFMAMGQGSRIEIHAADAAKDSWTQIDQTASAGSTTLTLAEDTGWEVGDNIVIASTGFDMSEAEYRTITDVSEDGRTVTFDASLEHDHFGEIETYTNGKEGEDFQSWELDMRAEVALLSRNVTIQGDDDSPVDGYGGHTMIMDGASMKIDGAELTRMGQIGEIGRYPLHWHMLGDASGQFVTNSSVHETYNKGVTIHGTQNTWLQNNAIVNTIGHTYYFEDGSESGNVLLNNLGMNTVKSENTDVAAIGSDHTAVSTYWVTNPNNHLIGNHAAGSDDTGFWVLSQDHAEGKSTEAYPDLEPRKENPGTWSGNVSHSNVDDGFWIGTQFSEQGDPARQLKPGDKAGEPKLEQPFVLDDFTSFKNGEWGIWLRNGEGDFQDIKIADSNAGIQNWGDSNLRDSLFVGRSSNADDTLDQHVGWQLYDHDFSFKNVHFAGFTGEYDAAISNGWGFGRSTAYIVEGLTFAEDGTADNKYLNTLTIEPEAKVSDQGGVIAGGIIDVDGSLTGNVGGMLTPGIVDYNPNKHYDIANYADDGIEASGFNATEGAIWDAENRAWIHQSGQVIGKMAIFDGYVKLKPLELEGAQFLDENGDPVLVPKLQDAVPLEERAVFTIEKSDNNAKILVNQDAIVPYSFEFQFNADTSDGVEYVIEYEDKLPEALTVDLTDLPEGATVYYRFKGLPEDVVFWEADAAISIADFNTATGTTWFQEENGDYIVKAVADRFLHWRAPRTDTNVGEDRLFNDEFKLVIADRDLYAPTGDGQPYTSRAEHPFVEAAPDPVPERATSQSGTVEIADNDQRWSTKTSWDSGLPTADDIVIIEKGQRIVLDTDVSVKAILINGGELIVEDTKDIALAADWVLVIGGGLFQAGTEENPFEHEFTLTLEGDDQENDIDVMALLMSTDPNIVRAVETETPGQIELSSAGERFITASAEATQIYGNDGDDFILAGSAGDLLAGGAGSDVLLGSFGDDTLGGGAGNDEMTGGAGADTFAFSAADFDGFGVDTITDFTPGEDTIVLSGFSETGFVSFASGVAIDTGVGGLIVLEGIAEEDLLAGDIVAGPVLDFALASLADLHVFTDADDRFATTGDVANIVRAGGGDDSVLTAGGSDRIEGDAGSDFLAGGAGEDTIVGGAGNDVLSGGLGADRFEFVAGATGFINDTITDFEIGEDVVALSGYAAPVLLELLGSAAAQLSATEFVVFEGVALAELEAAEEDVFVFVFG